MQLKAKPTEIKPAVNVHVSRRFYASPQEVFDAWFDDEQAAKWLFATKTGKMLRAEIDPRVGGQFLFIDRRDGKEVTHRGEYLEIKRPYRLSFNFSVEQMEPARVTITILPLDDGCELNLLHEHVYPEFAEQTQAGWEMILDGLAEILQQ